eukprot:4612046-Pyramimonas_sp.AAC.2
MRAATCDWWRPEHAGHWSNDAPFGEWGTHKRNILYKINAFLVTATKLPFPREHSTVCGRDSTR